MQLGLSGTCSWSLEAIFSSLKGISDIKTGRYNISNLSISFFEKDNLDIVNFTYDPNIISIESILNVFYSSHNLDSNSWTKESCFFPLTRSSILYPSEEVSQQNNISNILSSLGITEDKTKIIPYNPKMLTLMEEKYCNYFNKYPNDEFSISNIIPKLEKIKTQYPLLFK